jgi:hypothetical protein
MTQEARQSSSATAFAMVGDNSDGAHEDGSSDSSIDSSRRSWLRAMGSSVPLLAVLSAGISPAVAKGLKPDAAFAGLLKGREELVIAARTFVAKRDSEGLRSYLNDEAVNINSYELNAQALLESKRLDNESKKDIGTIRRYGVGADVIIMYGGLKAEANEENPNYSEVQKYLKRTVDSLDEVITICESNGF